MAESGLTAGQRVQFERDKALSNKLMSQGGGEPYNIYKEGSPTARAQDRMNDLASSGANAMIDTAKRNFGPAVDAAVTATGGKLVQQGIDRLSADAVNNQTAVNRYELGQAGTRNELMREKTPSDFRPASSGLVNQGMQRDGIQSSRIGPETQQSFNRAMADTKQMLLSTHQTNLDNMPGKITIGATGETAAIDGAGKMSYYDANGKPLSALSQKLLSSNDEQPGDMMSGRGGTARVGNLDVTFDNSVDQSARARFLKDPVRPTAQIDRYNLMNDGSSGGLTQGQVASMNAGRIIGSGRSSQDMPKAIAPSGPSKTWAQAADTDKKVIENAAARREARDRTRLETLLMQEEGQNRRHAGTLDMAGRNNQLELMKENNRSNEARYKNDIDAGLSRSQARHFDAETDVKKGQLTHLNRLDEMERKYLDPNTSPEEKKQIAFQHRVLSGKEQPKYQITTTENVDPKTMQPIKRAYAVNPDDPANSIEIGNRQVQAPQTALDALAKNPDRKQEFMKKYGYLPSGQ